MTCYLLFITCLQCIQFVSRFDFPKLYIFSTYMTRFDAFIKDDKSENNVTIVRASAVSAVCTSINNAWIVVLCGLSSTSRRDLQ